MFPDQSSLLVMAVSNRCIRVERDDMYIGADLSSKLILEHNYILVRLCHSLPDHVLVLNEEHKNLNVRHKYGHNLMLRN